MSDELRTRSGRVVTDAEIEQWAAEAQHGYDVSSGRPRPWECCSYRDADENGRCPCPDPKHAGDPYHSLAAP